MRIPRWIQASVALACFGLLCWDAGRRLPLEYPSLRRCLADPKAFEGRTIWVQHSRVAETAPGAFVVDHREAGRLRIESNLQPALGDFVMVQGVFDGHRGLRALRTSVNRWYDVERWGIYVVSAITLVAVALLARRRFAWRDGALHPR